MNEIYEGSVVEEGPGKLERTLFTLLYAFFLSICVQLIFGFGGSQTSVVSGFLG